MPLIVTAFRILSGMPNIGHVQTVRKLYKTIFRLHRGLPLEMQALGDSYLREEFKRHKTVDDKQQRDVFLGEWTVGIIVQHVPHLSVVKLNEVVFSYLMVESCIGFEKKWK